MTFAWPYALLSMLAVPALLGVYLVQRRRKRRSAITFSSIALIRAAMPSKKRWRTLLPLGLFLVAIASLAVGSARPQAAVKVPIGRTSIILALDVSRSMCVSDVPPNRLTVAQDAARRFIADQPGRTRIGIVAFAGYAELVVPPTTDKRALTAAIDGFTTARGTAIGSAMLKSIDAISSVNNSVRPIGNDANADSGDGLGAIPIPPSTDPSQVPADTVAPPKEGYVPDIVVLLTDGANTRGIPPLDAVAEAVKRRIRVYTIGFGTTNPTEPVCTAQQLGGEGLSDGSFGGSNGFGGGGIGGGGGNIRPFLVVDEPTLREVARVTGGRYYKAEDANQLRKVFDGLPKQVVLQKRKVELSAVFAGLGAILVALATGLSLFWNRST